MAHVPPMSFKRGDSIAIELTVPSRQPALKSVQMYFRHTHQASAWQQVIMKAAPGKFRAEIPDEYTDRYYPLEYYFEPGDEAGRAWLYPGLGPTLTQQPYFVIRPT